MRIVLKTCTSVSTSNPLISFTSKFTIESGNRKRNNTKVNTERVDPKKEVIDLTKPVSVDISSIDSLGQHRGDTSSIESSSTLESEERATAKLPVDWSKIKVKQEDED